jgi:hypothetical protein
MFRPGKDELLAECLRAKTAVTVARCKLVAKAHLIELTDRPRSEAVAAGLVPWKVLPLHHEHIGAALSEPVGRGST